MLKTFVTLLTNLQLSLECSVREPCGVLLPRMGAYAQNGCGAGGNNGECLNANVQDAMSARDPLPIPVTIYGFTLVALVTMLSHKFVATDVLWSEMNDCTFHGKEYIQF